MLQIRKLKIVIMSATLDAKLEKFNFMTVVPVFVFFLFFFCFYVFFWYTSTKSINTAGCRYSMYLCYKNNEERSALSYCREKKRTPMIMFAEYLTIVGGKCVTRV
jgi:hypothetical protein